MRFTGKVAIVTGAGSGIGRATAVRLAAEGAAVVVSDIDDEHGKETVSLIEAAGHSAVYVHADVSEEAEAIALVEAAEQTFGSLDIAINNAGVTRDQLLMRMKPEDFDAVIATNLRGTWNVCRAAARAMVKARWGRVINVSSVVAPSAASTATRSATSQRSASARPPPSSICFTVCAAPSAPAR